MAATSASGFERLPEPEEDDDEEDDRPEPPQAALRQRTRATLRDLAAPLRADGAGAETERGGQDEERPPRGARSRRAGNSRP